MLHRLLIGDTPHDIWLTRGSGGDHLYFAGQVFSLAPTGPDTLVVVDGDIAHVHHNGRAHMLEFQHPLDRLAEDSGGNAENVARAPMPGAVVSVNVMAGQEVAEGEIMVVIESMKLETAIRASRDGIVAEVHYGLGAAFDRDAVLVTLAVREQ